MSHEHGDKLHYDPKWKGPLKRRSCTDVTCLMIFLVFIVAWGGTGYFAYNNGDINSVLIPSDSKDRKCGVDPGVKNKKYLVFFDLIKCLRVESAVLGCNTTLVCVESCPTAYFHWKFEKAQYNLKNTDQEKEDYLKNLRDSMICQFDIDANTTFEQLESYIEDQSCAEWYLKSTNLTQYCVPDLKDLKSLSNELTKLNLTKKIDDITNSKRYIEVIEQGEKFLKEALEDLKNTRWTILGMLGGGALTSLIFIFLMRWIALPVVMVSILGVSALLACAIYFLYGLYKESTTYSNYWLTLGIICAVIIAILILVSIFLRKRILLACKLIGEASKAVSSTTSTLFFPLAPWILQISVLSYVVAVGVLVYTLKINNYRVQLGGNCVCPESLGYTNGAVCVPEVFDSNCTEENGPCVSGRCYLNGKTKPWFSVYIQFLNIVGFFWLTFFFKAFGEMVLAGTFSTWYWTFEKSNVPFFTLTSSVWRTIRYHMGTLAFGSLIITICNLIRLALEYVEKKLKKHDNAVFRFIIKCMKCYFWLLEKCIKFVNKNAYVMCAIHGKGFCRSARDASSLLSRNILRVTVLDKITSLLLFMGKLLVTGLVSCGAWYYIENQYGKTMPVPVVSIAIGSYLVASLFFSVYSMAVDTLFLCFLEDSERNDGSAEKPYYMSKGLMKILNKKNENRVKEPVN